MEANNIRVAVGGASGYAGMELLRLLASHPGVEVVTLAAATSAGERMGSLHRHLAPFADHRIEPLEVRSLSAGTDAAFLALPHGASMAIVPDLVEAGLRIVDLGGDFRLDEEAYPDWYGLEHAAPRCLDKAVYGLPELFADQVRGADLVANPGCYPTAALLALVPLMRAGLLEPEGIVIDAKSGISGAGRSATPATHFAHADESVRPYEAVGHRHTPEIERVLEAAADELVRVAFVPHLVPATRGLLATCYARLAEGAGNEDPHGVLAAAYAGSRFVRVLEPGDLPDTKRVRGSNDAEVGIAVDPRTETIVAAVAIDNLVKGAAGQAIQNLNLMFGLPEEAGLEGLALYP